jgi:Fe-S cluster assembly protein SufD
VNDQEKKAMAIMRRVRTPAAPPYARDDVIAHSRMREEPAWVMEQRLAAWDVYEALPMPYQEEEWRRTDYRGLDWGMVPRLDYHTTGHIDDVPRGTLEPLVGDEQGGLLVFVDGKRVHEYLAPGLAAQGVIFTDLDTAVIEHGDLLSERFMQSVVRPADGKFAALHGALWTHGVFAYIPNGVIAELPLHVVDYHTQASTMMGHILVDVGDKAEATMLVDYSSSPSGKPSVTIGATELKVGMNGALRYVSLQEWDRDKYEFSHQRAVIGRDSSFDWVNGVMGSRLTKAFIELDAVGQGANGRVSGFFFADKDQFFDLDTQQNHNAPLTTTDLLFKGAAKDHARTLWQGMIKSLPQMQRIDGYQTCRNLLLSENARMDSIPGLEIEADDVACSHAATFGTLEEEPVFYLMARGIPRAEAELMVIAGFYHELLERIPFPRVRERLNEVIEAKIIGA